MSGCLVSFEKSCLETQVLYTGQSPAGRSLRNIKGDLMADWLEGVMVKARINQGQPEVSPRTARIRCLDPEREAGPLPCGISLASGTPMCPSPEDNQPLLSTSFSLYDQLTARPWVASALSPPAQHPAVTVLPYTTQAGMPVIPEWPFLAFPEADIIQGT